jgi:hypothetical protein
LKGPNWGHELTYSRASRSVPKNVDQFTVLPFWRKFPFWRNFELVENLVENSWETLLGNLLSLCREIAGARDILQKFKNLKKGEISTYDFAFLRRRSRKLNCRKNFTNISSMESIYIISNLIVDWFKIQAMKLVSYIARSWLLCSSNISSVSFADYHNLLVSWVPKST